MQTIKNIIQWIRGFSFKTTVVLAFIGMTLFDAMKEALVGSIASGGNSDIYIMTFAIWLSVMFVVLFFIAIMLVIAYAFSKIIKHFKNKKVDKKAQQKSN